MFADCTFIKLLFIFVQKIELLMWYGYSLIWPRTAFQGNPDIIPSLLKLALNDALTYEKVRKTHKSIMYAP